jgi:hypothetical protein
MTTSTIRPCKCGSTPAYAQSQRYGINILRLECACGQHGATLMFTKREQEAAMRQAGIDGWNLAG